MANILIADDSSELSDLIIHIYTRRNFFISTAKSREDLFYNLKRVRPDLILLDVILAGDDGREICRELKSTVEYKDIPVILMSGSPETLVNYREVFADDFMEKPFNIETILSKVKAQLPARVN